MAAKILFITSTHLGDGVLSTGALAWLIENHPGAEITVACGPVTAGIFAKAPGVVEVIPMKKEPRAGHWRKLARATMWKKWDVVVDLRNSLISRLLSAKKKYIWKTENKRQHKVEQIASALGNVVPAPAPKLWFDADTIAAAEKIAPDGKPILALGPTANWPGKEWAAANYIELAQKLTAPDGVLPGARIAVIAAPGEEARAYEVLNAFEPARRVDAIAKGGPLLGAAVLRRCAMFIGNDSGPMHMAAAVGIPAVGLFGYGWPELYRPWGPNGSYARTKESPAQLIAPFKGGPGEVKHSLLGSLTVPMVHDTAVSLWKSL